MFTQILGGTRSGKSRLAQRLSARSERVCYIATARIGDDAEMSARGARHRSDRPAHWRGAVERAGSEAGLPLYLKQLAGNNPVIRRRTEEIL